MVAVSQWGLNNTVNLYIYSVTTVGIYKLIKIQTYLMGVKKKSIDNFLLKLN